MVVLDHVAVLRLVVATNFGRAFILVASACVEFGQWAAKPSSVMRPKSMPSIESNSRQRRKKVVVQDEPVEALSRPIDVAINRDEDLHKELPHDPSPITMAASESRRDWVPCSLWAAVSWPSRNTPCSVRTRCVVASWRRNWTVATDTEIRVSSAYIS